MSTGMDSTVYSQTRIPGVISYNDPNGNEIRRFADSGIQASIDAAIAAANLKPDQHGTVVAYADKEAIKLAVVVRPFSGSPNFSVVGTLTHDWSGSASDWNPALAVSYRF
jgi:hypothetical protein